MITVLLAMLIFVISAAGLALGIMLDRRPIKSGCGDCANCLCRRERS